MKVIDLLNKIANSDYTNYDEEIKLENEILTIGKFLSSYIFNTKRLNDEVEIIEEDKKIKKLENLNVNYCRDGNLYETLTKDQIALDISTLQNWINKIIDYLEEKDNGKR